MKIVMAGASGFIGRALRDFLKTQGHEVMRLKRGIDYDPIKKTIALKELENSHVIINLAGESIFQRWSDSAKEKIMHSRISIAHLIAEALTQLQNPPLLLINASAIGYYGDRGEQTVDETSPPGVGFLAEVAQAWEKALSPVIDSPIRLVMLRLGVVISPEGGALKKMLLPFKLGLGGKIGHGGQFMSWISLRDVLGAIYHIIYKNDLHGPINLVSPHAVRNLEFTKALGKQLHRPTVMSVPAWAIRGLLGQMGEEVLLASTKVEPKKLLDSGYPFLDTYIETAIKT